MKSAIAIIGILATSTSLYADAAEEMARKMQDPLANISAVMTDNDVLFKSGKENDDVSYSFQIQPVQAFSFDDAGFNFIARAVIPILGIAQKAVIPPSIDNPSIAKETQWGMGDIVAQTFFSPKTDSAWNWGVGPMASLKTRTNDNLGGASWGAGPVGVLVGNISENISSAFIVGHMWGDSGNFSTSTIQPMFYYNIPTMPGVSISYNATTSYNWKAESGNRITLPLGASIGKMFDLGDGIGIEASGGLYANVINPEGASDVTFKWAINILLP